MNIAILDNCIIAFDSKIRSKDPVFHPVTMNWNCFCLISAAKKFYTNLFAKIWLLKRNKAGKKQRSR